MDYSQESMNFNDCWRVVKGRKKVVILFFFTTVFLVTLASFLMRPVYRATVTLLIDVENPKVLTTTGNIALERSDYYAYKEYYQSQKEIIQSRNIMRKVFDEFNLGSTRRYARSKDPIKDFMKTITVEPIRETRLLNLNVDNNDPKLAADIANRIAEIYVARNLSYISKSEVINLLKNEHLQLQARLSEYSKIYKDKHPQMERLKQEMEQMEERMREEKNKSYGSDTTDTSSSGATPAVADLTFASLNANNISIQDGAEVSKIPLKPKKRLNILLAVIVGLFGGIGLAFFFEYLDDTVKNIEDIERVVDWPFLGDVPKINNKSRMSESERDLFVQLNPKDPASEAYRAIRTSLMFSSTEEKPLHSIIITSPGPKEGKTLTLCNLGIAIAQSHKKVLLVDADMRKPRLHEVFKGKNDAGLSSFLSGQEELKDVIQNTELENLSYIAGGPHSPNPSELLTSHKTKGFLDTVKAKYDVILIDTPPIAVVTDALILSKITDGTIVVLESGKTGRRILSRVNRMFNDAQARIAGIILNKVSPSRGGYHYYYYAKTK